MYTEHYDSPGIRSGAYDCMDYLGGHYKVGVDVAADLGCGTCRKIIPVAPLVGNYEAIDESDRMLQGAARNIGLAGVTNIRLSRGCSFSTPYASHAFDLVSSFLSPYLPSEAHRLLRPNGRFLIETLDACDKAEFKQAFGTDEHGGRGIYLNLTSDERLGYIKRQLDPFFELEQVEAVEFETELTDNGVWELMCQTPTIRDFGNDEDKEILSTLKNAKGLISFIERRILISCYAK